MSIDLLSFFAGAIVGSVVTFYTWRYLLIVGIGRVLSGKRQWYIGGRQFTIVEKK